MTLGFGGAIPDECKQEKERCFLCRSDDRSSNIHTVPAAELASLALGHGAQKWSNAAMEGSLEHT